MAFRVLDLFSGYGGFSYGLEATGGFETVAFCEIEDYPRRILAKHWPGVPVYRDVRDLTADALRRDGIVVDAISGGFPCQDVSFAGKRAGLEGARSGLWAEYWRLIGELRPRFVLIENVPGLLSLGLARVLGDLAQIGYDAVWDCIPACAVGAPHRRDRVWIIAYARGQQHKGGGDAQRGTAASQLHASDTNDTGLERRDGAIVLQRAGERVAGTCGPPMADADGELLNGGGTTREGRGRQSADGGGRRTQSRLGGMVDGPSHWLHEPAVPRVAAKVENRVARLKALGNGVVPHIPYIIGRAILKAEGVIQ